MFCYLSKMPLLLVIYVCSALAVAAEPEKDDAIIEQFYSKLLSLQQRMLIQQRKEAGAPQNIADFDLAKLSAGCKNQCWAVMRFLPSAVSGVATIQGAYINGETGAQVVPPNSKGFGAEIRGKAEVIKYLSAALKEQTWRYNWFRKQENHDDSERRPLKRPERVGFSALYAGCDAFAVVQLNPEEAPGEKLFGEIIVIPDGWENLVSGAIAEFMKTPELFDCAKAKSNVEVLDRIVGLGNEFDLANKDNANPFLAAAALRTLVMGAAIDDAKVENRLTHYQGFKRELFVYLLIEDKAGNEHWRELIGNAVAKGDAKTLREIAIAGHAGLYGPAANQDCALKVLLQIYDALPKLKDKQHAEDIAYTKELLSQLGVENWTPQAKVEREALRNAPLAPRNEAPTPQKEAPPKESPGGNTAPNKNVKVSSDAAGITDPNYLLDLARVHLRRGRESWRAEPLLRTALTNTADSRLKQTIYQMLGTVLRDKHELKEAADLAAQALREATDPGDQARMKLDLAEIESRAGDTQGAEKILDELSRLETGAFQGADNIRNTAAYNLQQLWHSLPGGIEEVVRTLEAALDKDPKDVTALDRLARIYGSVKWNAAKAEQYYERLLALRPGDEEIQTRLASFYQNQRKYDKAIEVYREIMSKAANNEKAKEAALRIADLLIFSGNKDEGAAFLTKSCRQLLKSPDDFSRLAELYQRAVKLDENVEALNKAADVSPSLVQKADFQLQAAEIELTRKNYSNAEELITSAGINGKDDKQTRMRAVVLQRRLQKEQAQAVNPRPK